MLYLVDYELIGQSENGLDLIASLGLQGESVLVTSRYDEPAIRDRCEAMAVRLLPKPMTGFVPIQCVSPRSRRLDGVLIDDTPGNLAIWANTARLAGKAIQSFASLDHFLRAEWMFDLTTPISVDWHLGGGVNGADASRRVADLGFTDICIVTNDDTVQAKLAEMPWIRAVRGKLPPWVDV